MPRRSEPSWDELKLGVAVVVVALIGVLAVALMGTTRGPFAPAMTTYYLELDDAAGIRVGSFVRVAGLPAGQVTNVEIAPPEVSAPPPAVRGDSLLPAPEVQDPGDIRIELAVEERFDPFLTSRSRAQLASLGMGGERYVKISAGDVREDPLPAGATIPEIASVDWDLILAKLARAINEMQVIAGMAADIQGRVAAGGGTAGRLLDLEGPLYGKVRALQAESEATIALLDQGDGLLARYGRDPTLARQIDSLTANLAAIDALSDSGGLAVWGDPVALRVQVDTLGQDLARFSSRLASGRGTLGRLIHDEELFLQIRVLQTRVAEVVAAFRADPLSFVNIELF